MDLGDWVSSERKKGRKGALNTELKKANEHGLLLFHFDVQFCVFDVQAAHCSSAAVRVQQSRVSKQAVSLIIGLV